ncbi:hypothetical protein XM38_002930 [Halomicronema hongdechloris C2206]|uniref:DUF2232 domain-containing protein n=1 Tax=Halomicronema hongdechloris C2206 TaxID=1641165 RepID=A0A1Z3HGG6_9CYAN|nr:DUF2232 domain-containing protein [Halomicronema hongdechloris]ASC69366.1 hypothetical protein XM38_002930 [Halomicronema hongdechloris C2206]
MSDSFAHRAFQASSSSSSSSPDGSSDREIEAEFEDVEAFLTYTPASGVGTQRLRHQLASKAGPLVMVETAFLASTASLIWLINAYFPPGPLLRIFFPVPMAMVYLRWGARAAWMSALVASLLLAVLMGPPRSLLFLMPYGVLGVQLGYLWFRRANWYVSIAVGTLLGSLGFFFRIWLLSMLIGEDLWVYLINQMAQILDWILERLVDLGILGVAVLGQVDLLTVQGLALVMVVISNVVYLFTVHLAAGLLLERLGMPMPAPPRWVQVLLES